VEEKTDPKKAQKVNSGDEKIVKHNQSSHIYILYVYRVEANFEKGVNPMSFKQ